MFWVKWIWSVPRFEWSKYKNKSSSFQWQTADYIYIPTLYVIRYIQLNPKENTLTHFEFRIHHLNMTRNLCVRVISISNWINFKKIESCQIVKITDKLPKVIKVCWLPYKISEHIKSNIWIKATWIFIVRQNTNKPISNQLKKRKNKVEKKKNHWFV